MSVMTHRTAGFVDRVAAAAMAGYTGIGLRPGDRRRAHDEGLSDADLRSILADHGIEVIEIEGLQQWAMSGDRGERARAHEHRLYELTDALGGSHVSVTGDVDLPHGEVVERFGAICDRASDHGLRVALEFVPWTRVADAGSAWDIVAEAGRSNGGVLVDTWHHFRGAADDALLTAIPPDRVFAVQFDDAMAEVRGSLFEDTIGHRLPPGAGSFALVPFLRLLASHGVRAPLCVEVINDVHQTLPVAEVARTTAEATNRVLREAFDDEYPLPPEDGRS